MYSQVIFQNQNDMTFERRSILDYSEYKAWATSSTEVIGITCTKRTCFMIDKHYVQIEQFDDGLNILRIQPPHGGSVSPVVERKLEKFTKIKKDISRDEKFTMRAVGAKNFEKVGRVVPAKYFTFDKK